MAKLKLHAEEKQRQDRNESWDGKANRPSLCLLGLQEAGGEWSVIICEQERWRRVHESGLMLLWLACPMKEQSDFIKVWSQSDSYLSKSFRCCPFCHEGATLQAPQDISNFPMFQSDFQVDSTNKVTFCRSLIYRGMHNGPEACTLALLLPVTAGISGKSLSPSGPGLPHQ